MTPKGYTIEIVPAVLVRTYEELCGSLERIRGTVPLVQVDVVDGVFAPNVTWPLKDETHFEHIVAGDEGMPLWDNFDFEFDLMLAHPAQEVEQYVQAGASRIVLHARSEGMDEALTLLQPFRNQDFSVEVGIGIIPQGSARELKEFDEQFDYIQVMGIEHLGLQGQQLSSDAFPLIKELRRTYPDKTIQIDGGVRLENIQQLVEAGANRLIVGSAVFGTDDPARAIARLEREANR